MESIHPINPTFVVQPMLNNKLLDRILTVTSNGSAPPPTSPKQILHLYRYGFSARIDNDLSGIDAYHSLVVDGGDGHENKLIGEGERLGLWRPRAPSPSSASSLLRLLSPSTITTMTSHLPSPAQLALALAIVKQKPSHLDIKGLSVYLSIYLTDCPTNQPTRPHPPNETIHQNQRLNTPFPE